MHNKSRRTRRGAKERGFSYAEGEAPEILRGAKQIAAYYLQDSNQYRHIYYLVETARFPHFREGTTRICVRRATLDRWIAQQEDAAIQGKSWSPTAWQSGA
jgi:hypothetical protein